MASRRMVDVSFWQSETMAGLPMEQRLLFIGLFSNADDQGRLRAHPALIRSMVFPYDDVELGEIEAGLRALDGVGSVHLYVANGGQCLQIVNWWKYQKLQWAAPSKIPAPGGWRDRVRHREGGRIRQQNWDEQTAEESSGEALGKALGKALAKGSGKGDRQSFSQGDRIEENSDSNSDRSAEYSDSPGEGRGGAGLSPAPATRLPEPARTGKNGSGARKSGKARVREGPETAIAGEKRPIRARAVGELSEVEAGEVPDPAGLTVRQIQALELDEAGWEVLQAREEAGKRRASALGHIERMLNKAPPAVVVYQRVVELWPGRALWDEIGRVVGEEPDDLAFWERVVKGYLLCGWNKLNVGTMLEFYRRREVPPGKRTNGGVREPADPVEVRERVHQILSERYGEQA